ncbi:MAG TPA: hypothetical protein VK603_16740 [Candidatus Saccharimonadales bacterium]|nr:hypothetical protein [Candidatus Saccharimonadales bacterium]
MTKEIAPLTERQAWKALEAHYENVRELNLRKLFRMTLSAASASRPKG